MFQLQAEHPTLAALLKESRESGVFVRDVSSMSANLDSSALRIAVKDRKSNQIVLQTLENVLCSALHA